MRQDRSVIQNGIVIVWAIWFTIVFATNLCDGLKAFEFLPPTWTFASGNYELMKTTTSRYHTPKNLTAMLFLGVVLWEGLATLFFWRAVFIGRSQRKPGIKPIYSAFACSLALWSAFLIADELFVVYEMEASHLRLFIAQLVSLLFLELPPDDRKG